MAGRPLARARARARLLELDTEPAPLDAGEPQQSLPDIIDFELLAGDRCTFRRTWPLPARWPADAPAPVFGTIVGPWTLEDAAGRYGGGAFEVCVKRKGWKNPRVIRLTIDAPIKPLAIESNLDAYTNPHPNGNGQSAVEYDPPNRVAEVLEIIKACRELIVPPATSTALSPDTLVQWGRTMFSLGREITPSEPPADSSPWERVVDRLPDILDRFATLRGAPVPAPAAVPALPPSGRPPAIAGESPPPALPSAPAGAGRPAQPGVPRETVDLLVAELVRGLREHDEPDFTAAWIERYMPNLITSAFRDGGPVLDRELARLGVPELLAPEGREWLASVGRCLRDEGAEPELPLPVVREGEAN